MKFVLWSPGYNCKNVVASNIISVQSQTHQDFLHVVCDDATNDGTADVIEKLRHPRLEVYRNETNMGWLYNALNYLDRHVTDDCVVVSLDLDDWLAHNRVLEMLNDLYENNGCWITYGSLVALTKNGAEHEPKFCYKDEIFYNRSFRKYLNFFAHLRTFRGFLWKKINKKDLCNLRGEPLKYSSDVGYSLPILEMAPAHRVVHIEEPLYMYNSRSQFNDDKIHAIEQRRCGDYFRSLTPYEQLKDDLSLYVGGNDVTGL